MSYTIGKMLTMSAERFPHKVAIICNGTQVTYQKLNSRVNQLAHGFLAHGITRTKRVALLMYNSIEMVETIFSLAKVGGVGIPLNFRLSPPELLYSIEKSDATTLIAGEEFEPTIHQLRPQLPCVEYLTISHLALNQPDHEPSLKVQPDDESFIIYTSGTTGKPKGAVLTHRNHFWNALNYTLAYQMNERDVELALSPMFHSSTLGRIFTYVFNGATFITSPHFDPEQAMTLVHRYQVTSITQTPTMYAAMFNLPHHHRYSTNSVTRVVSGAAPLFPKVKGELAHLFPQAGIYDLYGLTEASPGISILTPHAPPEKMRSVGKPMMSVTIKIVDDEGRALPRGENGEIACRGPNVMKGYYNDPTATQEALKEGWLHTGDMGNIDQDGYLYLTGRKKELIISGGENISPPEVEAVLAQHPLIQEAAVIGVPDDYWGESVKAIVVLKPGKKLTEQEVIEYCTAQLARYKKPKSVEFVDTLPKNAGGKVIKAALRERYLSQ
jgi:acyl-CoA synthetase (AMP-forming)/AMP-acid ligase II